jgi:uncharacterized protein YdiU (UPF0061 family)
MVFSSIDRQGRYAYCNQPAAAQWNLARLAETLLPLLELEAGGIDESVAWANDALSAFTPQFEAAHILGLRHKLGLSAERDSDGALAKDLLDRMAANRADFTLTFRRLCDAAVGPQGDAEIRNLFADPGAYDSWAAQWRQRLAEDGIAPQERAAQMKKVNPLFIPRNHQVEAVLDAAVAHQDMQPFEDLLRVVLYPYDDQPGMGKYALPALPQEQVYETFCGT